MKQRVQSVGGVLPSLPWIPQWVCSWTGAVFLLFNDLKYGHRRLARLNRQSPPPAVITES